jgi:hypothetical protein
VQLHRDRTGSAVGLDWFMAGPVGSALNWLFRDRLTGRIMIEQFPKSR